MINIIQLQRLFDKEIYSTYTELDLENQSDKIVSSKIATENILDFFTDEASFHEALDVYAQTLIRIFQSQDSYNNIPLVPEMYREKNCVVIKHDVKALKSYLYRKEGTAIINPHTRSQFIIALKHLKFNSELFYDKLMNSYQYNCTPEDFKSLFGSNYINGLLRVKIITPIEKRIKELYDKGEIPFYLKYTILRSIFERGGKIVKFTFTTVDSVAEIRLKRLRQHYMTEILKQLKEYLPFDYPFIEENLKTKDDETISKIYHFITNITQDPDYNKIDTGFLVRYKLRQDYGVDDSYE